MNWLKKASNSNIQIVFNDYVSKMSKAILEFSHRSSEYYDSLIGFSLNENEVVNILNSVQYPNVQEILNAIHSKSSEQLTDAMGNLLNWFSVDRTGKREQVWDVYKILSKYRSTLYNSVFTEQDAIETIEELKQKTSVIMNTLVNAVKNIIQNIPNWSGTALLVYPQVHGDSSGKDNWFEPAEDATIYFGSIEGPLMTLFSNEGKLTVDDIDDADEETFENSRIKQDYFNLVREIQNPGSSNKSKFLTLYTARPSKDRELYLNATTVPSNIYLTTNYAEARDLAIDQPGGGGIVPHRDVWKVIIDERYLIKTLDMGMQKHYQAVGEGQVPVKRIALVDTFD